MVFLYIGIMGLAVLLVKKAGLFSWVKPSMEGPDGKSSARAITNAWYVGLNTIISLGILYLCYIVVKSEKVLPQAISAIWALIYLVAIYNGTILLIFGIVSAQNIISFVKGVRGNSDKTEDTITVETKTVSEIKPGSPDEKPIVTSSTSDTNVG